MAHVLVASPDARVCEALTATLRTAGYAVVTTLDGALALAALCSATDPLLALVDERFAALAARVISATFHGGLLLERHAYILVTAAPQPLDSDRFAEDVATLDARVLSLPYSLWSLLATAQEAEEALSRREGALGESGRESRSESRSESRRESSGVFALASAWAFPPKDGLAASSLVCCGGAPC